MKIRFKRNATSEIPKFQEMIGGGGGLKYQSVYFVSGNLPFNIMYLLHHFDRDLNNLLVIKPVLSLSKSLKYSVNLTFLACTAFLILSSTSLRATGLAKD